jgi:ribosome biogenesis protein SSF1/2
VLVHYNADRDTVDFRHYLITIRAQGVSRRVRKLLEGTRKTQGGSVIDLGNEKDVADFILKQAGTEGYETASSYASDAEEGGENKVELPSDYLGRNNRKGEQRSVSLDEIGPRMELKLLKVSEGMPGREGAVIWHRFGESDLMPQRTKRLTFIAPPLVKKTAAEIKALKIEHAERARLRKQRREEQEANIARKKASSEKTSMQDEEEEEDEEDAKSEEEGDEADWDENDEVSESGVDSGSSDSESEEAMPLHKRAAKHI